MVLNCPRWFLVVFDSLWWFQVVQIYSGWFLVVSIGPMWSHVVAIGRKWLQVVHMAYYKGSLDGGASQMAPWSSLCYKFISSSTFFWVVEIFLQSICGPGGQAASPSSASLPRCCTLACLAETANITTLLILII